MRASATSSRSAAAPSTSPTCTASTTSRRRGSSSAVTSPASPAAYLRGRRGRAAGRGGGARGGDGAGEQAARRSPSASCIPYANTAHERAAVAIIREAPPGVEVSAGALIANEYRECERTSTAVLDAYIKPVLKNYLGRVASGMQRQGFSGQKFVMNSSGGALTFDLAGGRADRRLLRPGRRRLPAPCMWRARPAGRTCSPSMSAGPASMPA